VTKFIFTLSPEVGHIGVERAIVELSAAFPQHEFLGGDADFAGYANNILALHGSPSNYKPGDLVLPDEKVVQEVRLAFRQIVQDLKGWKPS
jgi:hypothetical protein